MKSSVALSVQPRATSSSPGVLASWHLLSLDAPAVATTWTVFVAHASHVPLPLSCACAMFLAVWIIYASDRLLDARQQLNLEARHRFHRRNRVLFRAGLGIATAALVPLIAILPARTRDAYLILGAALLLWLLVVHLAARPTRRIPKELAVGLFFSAAIFLPTLCRAPLLATSLTLPALFFANLCSLNCLFIYAWEHSLAGDSPQPHPSTAFGLRILQPITFASVLLPLMILPLTAPEARPILLAISLAATLLLILDRGRAHLSRVNLRAAADLALLVPLAMLPFLR